MIRVAIRSIAGELETKQMTLATAGFAIKTKVTRCAQFLAEMDEVVPWSRLLSVVEPHYPMAEQGRPRPPVERMLRIYFMQQWFNLSDPAMEDALYDSEAMRRFAGIDPGADVVPDESTVLRFRHLLEKYKLTERIFQEVRQLLEERKLLLKSGTIVDATIIAAPPSTKNATNSRDPEMKQVRKGNQWHFGMKVHVGADRHGLVHSLATGPASQGDITRLDELLHGEERELFGDQAYWSEDHRQHCRHAGIRYRVNRRARPRRTLTKRVRETNRRRSTTRARGEHAFHVVKTLWGFAKVRYRGLAKNTVRAFTAFALANLYLARRTLLATQG
jgi:IS5 family transposase